MEGHRKIELQYPDDLSFLIGNVRAAAAARLNEAFPPVDGHDGQDDDLRLRIEKEVDEYIARTFSLVIPNLTINGLDVSPTKYLPSLSSKDVSDTRASQFSSHSQQSDPEVVFETFDSRKRDRHIELCRQEEDLLSEIAALKHKVPAAAAARWGAKATEATRADDEALAQTLAALGSEDQQYNAKSSPQSGTDVLGCSSLPRQEAVEQSFGTSVAALGTLAKEMPATVAKMDRAKAAGEYVGSRS